MIAAAIGWRFSCRFSNSILTCSFVLSGHNQHSWNKLWKFWLSPSSCPSPKPKISPSCRSDEIRRYCGRSAQLNCCTSSCGFSTTDFLDGWLVDASTAWHLWSRKFNFLSFFLPRLGDLSSRSRLLSWFSLWVKSGSRGSHNSPFLGPLAKRHRGKSSIEGRQLVYWPLNFGRSNFGRPISVELELIDASTGVSDTRGDWSCIASNGS